MAWIAAALGMGLLVGWIATRTRPSGADGVQLPDPVRAAEGPGPETRVETPRTVPGRPDDPAPELKKVYEGRGMIRGQVQVPPGVDFPERWQLVLEPARFLEGRERAVGRIVDMADGAREFEVKDLPLGGYEVSARAPGLNGIPEPVLLYTLKGREDLPGATYSYVNLHLLPAGFVDGSVVDQDGVPVGDLPVYLKGTRNGELLETRTDPAGNYLFPVVLDGEYEIGFGDASSPLRPPERFNFSAPSMRYPERRIPASVHVTFRVYDERGNAVANASVRGYAEEGGTIDVSTDELGEARVPYLPMGEYHVQAKDRGGKRGKLSFATRSSERTKVVEIVVKP